MQGTLHNLQKNPQTTQHSNVNLSGQPNMLIKFFFTCNYIRYQVRQRDIITLTYI